MWYCSPAVSVASMSGGPRAFNTRMGACKMTMPLSDNTISAVSVRLSSTMSSSVWLGCPAKVKLTISLSSWCIDERIVSDLACNAARTAAGILLRSILTGWPSRHTGHRMSCVRKCKARADTLKWCEHGRVMVSRFL